LEGKGACYGGKDKGARVKSEAAAPRATAHARAEFHGPGREPSKQRQRRPPENRGGRYKGKSNRRGGLRVGWAQYEDTRKIFTRGVGLAQVPVGVKTNRLQ
jgi:hypothetical protein